MIKIFVIVCVLSSGSQILAAQLNKTRVCVIGAGVGGLSSARYLKDAGVEFVVLESTKYIGGTWRYDDRVGYDEYGLPIHTSMYKHQRTNLPKVAMELPNLPIPEEIPSFFSWDIYYNYLKNYTTHFDLNKYIKFLHQVTSVERVDNIWNVKYVHVPTGIVSEESFDYVIIASGRYSHPNLPKIPGEEVFKGTITHSHDYRVPDPYKCRRVLIVGAGPSGMDIGVDVISVSSNVVHSHHSRFKFRGPYPSNYIVKPDVKQLNETGALFVDGTFEEVDDVIYCTGYKTSFPFLDESSELTVTARGITPLHKNVLNINQPTMIILGMVTRACIVLAIDAQARYAVALIKGQFVLPDREEMMKELLDSFEDLRVQGRPYYHIHLLGNKEDQYYEELSKESGIERVKPVFSKIHFADQRAIFDNFYTFRNYVYTIIDDQNFTRTYIEEKMPSIISCPLYQNNNLR